MGTTPGGADRIRALVALLAAGVLLAACNAGSSSATTSASASASASTSASAGASESSAASEDGTDEYAIEVADSDLGEILTDPDGRTVYLFTTDSEDTSTCTGGCLEQWPPVTVDDAGAAVAGDGVSAEVGTFTRDDGSLQVTVNGLPIYYFAGDAAAGDTNGQGVGEKWYVIGPDGEMIQ